MRSKLLTLSCLFAFVLSAQALQISADSIFPEYIPEPEYILSAEEQQEILSALDQMVMELSKSSFKPAAEMQDSGYWAYSEEGWPEFDDEILMSRLESIPTTIDMSFNSQVRAWIKVYTVRKRDLLQRMLGLRDIYFPMIEAELDRRHLPMELKYIPVIESALNTHAVSRVGATGLWQIMYPTGKELGLRIDTYVDERRDPVRATEAGLDYMEKLYGIYGDWLLVVAAYNCGPGNVNKAMRRSGGKKGIWEIFPYLPRETRGYVPAFISAAYAFHYYEDHGLVPWRSKFSYTLTDTIMFSENAHFDLIAGNLGMTVDELRYYNPELKRDFIPGKSGEYPLRLPFDKAMDLLQRKTEIETLASASAAPVAVEVASRAPSGSNDYYFDKTGYKRLVYTIKSGDNLGFISEWYDVRISDLKNWNNIYGNRIRAGQKLAVYKKEAAASRYEAVDGMTFDQKQGMIGKAPKPSSAESPESAATASTPALTSGHMWYTVKSGDNLWDIARAHPGNTVEGIAALNGISKRTTLKLGQKLKIKK